MKELKISRTTKRRDQKHQEILTAAADLMVLHGSGSVSLEDIAKHADVARKTIYNHFENKEALIKEMVMPVCDHAKDYLSDAKDLKKISLDQIWTYCLELWKTESLNSILLMKLNSDDCTEIESYKHGFVFVFNQLLRLVPEYSTLDDKLIKIMANTIYQVYLPILESIHTLDGYDQIFRNSMTGLISSIKQE
ncbi:MULTISPECIES: TetR/AcrR family transcriptional regulator [unclassified Fusibacter]|uniref:TetR/AcrR family transcriptional regulator n=1 Tax=unclassified Fusibacter TaxID=2624464 RepID=UPI00101010D3|nr:MULTISPECIES: TetR/AcrR family transcriptional regulator [unclassified Fusibacter]MCK8058535.1 TetR/AcrR family transcriptional regulator [Fusibacter sp. A2]NPE22696.1 TetR/AcrR family transcriptional regulator [Fusibacter sp. A1]RXV60256.1 TetR/AcrR family transcriptional regulator [Fusibacter sp. A1]